MSGDGDPEGRWVSYTELAAARGIDRLSAAKLALRRRWRRQKDNQGGVRVCVPPDWLRPERDQRDMSGDASGNASPDLSVVIKPLADAVALLREQLEAAEARAEAAAVRAEGERSRADALRDRLATAEAELQQAADRARQEAQEAAEALRQAEAARKAAGLLARLRAAWRGE